MKRRSSHQWDGHCHGSDIILWTIDTFFSLPSVCRALSFFILPSLRSLLCMCMCVCVVVCVCVYSSVCIQKSEDKCHSSPCNVRQGPDAYTPGKLVHKLLGALLSLLPLLLWKYRCLLLSLAFCGFCGSELRSSCFGGMKTILTQPLPQPPFIAFEKRFCWLPFT